MAMDTAMLLLGLIYSMMAQTQVKAGPFYIMDQQRACRPAQTAHQMTPTRPMPGLDIQ